MEHLLTAVIVAPFVITMVGFAVAIAFAPAVPNEIAPATDHDHDSRQLHRANPRRWAILIRSAKAFFNSSNNPFLPKTSLPMPLRSPWRGLGQGEGRV